MSLRLSFSNSLLFSFGAAVLLKASPVPSKQASVLVVAFIIFLILSLSRVLWACYLYPYYFSPLLYLPQASDKPSLFMGHFPQMLKAGPGEVLRAWTNTVPNHGIIRYLDFFNMERLAIVGPDALADVLTNKCYDFEKPPQLRKGISRILGMGLFLAEGEVHKKQRKNLMPAFAYRHVKNLYPMFWTKSQETMTAISASIDGQNDSPSREDVSVEVNEWATRATLDIIGKGGFGQSFNAIQDPDNELSRTYRSIFKQGRSGQILGLLGFLLPQWLVRRLPLLRNDRMKRASNFIRALCRSSIDSKRQHGSLELDGELDILTVAMKSGGFSDEELVDQMMTFLAAGHETTASALTWAIYIISKNLHVQERLRDEVDRHLPKPLKNSTSLVTAEMIEQMPYLSAVCREVLRLYSPVSVTIRVAVKDTTIAGQAIPKGTTIMPAPWAVNGSIDLWGGDALDFKPERWQHRKTSDSERKGTNYDYMTFLHGPRSCIGQTFAVGELSCLLAAWVAAFETRLTNPDYVPAVRGGITAKPKDGVHVHLKLREDR